MTVATTTAFAIHKQPAHARQHPPGLPQSGGVEASLGAWGLLLLLQQQRSSQELCLNSFMENQLEVMAAMTTGRERGSSRW